MSTLILVGKILLFLFLGMASIAWTIDAVTGWGEKGEYKKTLYLTLIISVLIVVILFVLGKIGPK